MITIVGFACMVFVLVFSITAFYKAPSNGQSPRESMIESWVNILIGFAINFAANLIIIPMMTNGQALSLASNFWGGWVYTSIAIVRQYAVRRWFNNRIHNLAKKLAHSA